MLPPTGSPASYAPRFRGGRPLAPRLPLKGGVMMGGIFNLPGIFDMVAILMVIMP